ncbi:unnamed protein product [Closterium sp. NIES-54]
MKAAAKAAAQARVQLLLCPHSHRVQATTEAAVRTGGASSSRWDTEPLEQGQASEVGQSNGNSPDHGFGEGEGDGDVESAGQQQSGCKERGRAAAVVVAYGGGERLEWSVVPWTDVHGKAQGKVRVLKEAETSFESTQKRTDVRGRAQSTVRVLKEAETHASASKSAAAYTHAAAAAAAASVAASSATPVAALVGTAVDCLGVGMGVGVGTQRTVQQFWEHCGVDFCRKVVSERARNGGLDASCFVDVAGDAGDVGETC